MNPDQQNQDPNIDTPDSQPGLSDQNHQNTGQVYTPQKNTSSELDPIPKEPNIIRPTQPEAQTPNTNNLPQYSQQVTAQAPVQNAQSRLKKNIMISTAVLFVLVISAGAAAYFISSNDSSPNSEQSVDEKINNEQSIEEVNVDVPGDWQVIDTDFGFSIKTPKGWAKAFPGDFTFNNLRSNTFNVNESISVGTERRTDSKKQEDFEKSVADTDEILKSYATFGIDKNQVEISSSKISINGVEWLQVYIKDPGMIRKTLYLWLDDHAIKLSAVSDNEQDFEQQSQYLTPIAASVELSE